MRRWWTLLGGTGIFGLALYLLAFQELVWGRGSEAFAISAIALFLGLGGMLAFTWAMLWHCLHQDLPGDLRLAYLLLIVGLVPVGAVLYSVQVERRSLMR